MIKTFQYRLYPSKSQQKTLTAIVETCRIFYNNCLAERKDAYEERKECIGKFDQLKKVKELKEKNPYAKNVHSHILQLVVTDLDKAFKAFFRRVKTGAKPGYPRFKGKNRFDSFGLKEYGNGFRVDKNKLKVSGIGRISVRWHRPLEGEIKTVRIKEKAGKWFASFACMVEDKLLPSNGLAVGIDVGIKSLLTTSDGEFFENPKWYRESQAKLRVIQRRVSRRKFGGRNRHKAVRILQNHHTHVVNQREDCLNKIAYRIAQKYTIIAIEDLQIQNMVKNHNLSKSILDGGWGYFSQQLAFKAAEAGRKLVRVSPAYTSKTCSNCGSIFEHLDLSVRWVDCLCGLSMDRDVNAAINILKKAKEILSRDGQFLWESTWVEVTPCVSQEAVAL